MPAAGVEVFMIRQFSVTTHTAAHIYRPPRWDWKTLAVAFRASRILFSSWEFRIIITTSRVFSWSSFLCGWLHHPNFLIPYARRWHCSRKAPYLAQSRDSVEGSPSSSTESIQRKKQPWGEFNTCGSPVSNILFSTTTPMPTLNATGSATLARSRDSEQSHRWFFWWWTSTWRIIKQDGNNDLCADPKQLSPTTNFRNICSKCSRTRAL